MSAILLRTGGQPLLQQHHHTGQINHRTGPTQIGTKRLLNRRVRIHSLSNSSRLQPQQGNTIMLSITPPMGVARGGVTTPTRTKRGDGVDGIINSSSSKNRRISRINGEINGGVELTSKWVESIVLVVMRGREDGRKLLRINKSISKNSSSNSVVTMATIRLEATTTNHSNSPLTNTVLSTRGSPMGIRWHSCTSPQQTDCHEAQGHPLYRSYSLLKLTRLVMRGVLPLEGSTPTLLLRPLAGERESPPKANDQDRISHHHHGNLGTDTHLLRVRSIS